MVWSLIANKPIFTERTPLIHFVLRIHVGHWLTSLTAVVSAAHTLAGGCAIWTVRSVRSGKATTASIL
jgi:hypothetical protein